TPQRIVDALNGEIVKALNTPDMKTFMARLGAEPRPMTPREFSAFIRSELAKWGKVVRESGARAD
ncbi:MAG: tripartite tricarboxylate transporter substrate binding protein, partial [Rudaea sp.]